MRMILTQNQKCLNNCPSCYYEGRIPGRYTNTVLLHEYIDRYPGSDIAIGFNSGFNDDEQDLLMHAIDNGCNIIVTVVPEQEIYNWVFEQLPNTDDTICISYIPGRMNLDLHVDILQCNLVLNVLDSHITDSNRELLDIASRYNSIYLLMEKGDPDTWTMDIHRLEIYRQKMKLAKKMFPYSRIIPDSCVMGILNNDIGCCSGEWLELNAYGEVRTCPYRRKPDYTIDSINQLELIGTDTCKCTSHVVKL